jgi:hypothetical protein
VERCRTFGEAVRFARRLSNCDALLPNCLAGPLTRILVLEEFGKVRAAAAAQCAALPLPAGSDTVDSRWAIGCRRGERIPVEAGTRPDRRCRGGSARVTRDFGAFPRRESCPARLVSEVRE